MVAAALWAVVLDGVNHITALDVIARHVVIGRVLQGNGGVFLLLPQRRILAANIMNFVGNDGVVMAADGNAVVPGAVGVVLNDQIITGSNGQTVVKGRFRAVPGNDGPAGATG